MKKALGILLLSAFFSFQLYAADLSFEDCMKEAAAGNKDLKSAAEKLAQAEFNKAVADSSLWPILSATGSLSENITNSTLSSSYNLLASYSIFDGFNAKYSMAQAEEQLKYARTVYDTTSASVRLKVRTAYIDVMKAQNLVSISADISARRKQSAAMIKLRYEGGNEHKGSWLLAEANYTQAKYDQAAATRGLDLARKELCLALGRREDSLFKVKENFSLTAKLSAKNDYKTLALESPQVLGAGFLASIAEYALNQSYTGNYPSLNATAGYGGSAVNGGALTSQFTLGLSASYTFFDGMKTKNESDKAASALRQARIDLDNAVISAVFQLQQSWTGLLNAADQVDSQQKFYEANAERTKIADAQYDQGLLTFDNWTLIEDQMISSEKNYLNARASALSAEAAWLNVLGRTMESYFK